METAGVESVVVSACKCPPGASHDSRTILVPVAHRDSIRLFRSSRYSNGSGMQYTVLQAFILLVSRQVRCLLEFVTLHFPKGAGLSCTRRSMHTTDHTSYLRTTTKKPDKCAFPPRFARSELSWRHGPKGQVTHVLNCCLGMVAMAGYQAGLIQVLPPTEPADKVAVENAAKQSLLSTCTDRTADGRFSASGTRKPRNRYRLGSTRHELPVYILYYFVPVLAVFRYILINPSPSRSGPQPLSNPNVTSAPSHPRDPGSALVQSRKLKQACILPQSQSGTARDTTAHCIGNEQILNKTQRNLSCQPLSFHNIQHEAPRQSWSAISVNSMSSTPTFHSRKVVNNNSFINRSTRPARPDVRESFRQLPWPSSQSAASAILELAKHWADVVGRFSLLKHGLGESQRVISNHTRCRSKDKPENPNGKNARTLRPRRRRKTKPNSCTPT
ncbi:hypothetical protein V8F33_012195 [Rhypophila sp. PSN 637]